MKKIKNIPSGSGCDAVPPREFENLEWLQPHMTSRSTTSNFVKKPVGGSAGAAEEEQEENEAFENDSMESLNREAAVECETEIGNGSNRSSNDVEPESVNQPSKKKKTIKAKGCHGAFTVRKARK